MTRNIRGMTQDIDRLSDLLRERRPCVALTGAGISTDSGIPDYRGPQGVWTKNPGAERMATIQAYVAHEWVPTSQILLRRGAIVILLAFFLFYALSLATWKAKPQALADVYAVPPPR